MLKKYERIFFISPGVLPFGFTVQPYVGCQHETILVALSQGFVLETISGALDVDTINFTLCLDAVARWIYQKHKHYITKNKGLVL